MSAIMYAMSAIMYAMSAIIGYVKTVMNPLISSKITQI